jgi:hypothetical protein
LSSDRGIRLEKQVLTPAATRAVASDLLPTPDPGVWVYRYTAPDHGWVLSIATHAEPRSGKMSLGGFRIAPEERTSLGGYDNDREAIGLAVGMEEKIYWSRLIKVGGPLALRDASRIVGGKCVLWPTPDARVGQPRDLALLDFAVACFREFEATSGAYLTTGQDLGHGLLSDGVTSSLRYVHDRFKGSVLSDTSKPTAEGNYYLLRGVLRALGIGLEQARVALIGCGNIGEHVLARLREAGSAVAVMEAVPAKRDSLRARGVTVWSPEDREEFLQRAVDAVVVNASGGSLDPLAVDLIAHNQTVRAVCGCENLAMPDPRGSELLRAAGKVYCPTELGGMMGYLTAVEEYLAHLDGVPFDASTLFEAARRLEVAGLEATTVAARSGFALSFEEAARKVFKE